ncbi:MAG TPA: DUF2127 domain-containing protein [Candidatus Saccharimonadales bacterium]|nr:DUF2127 domain-containing protein [Candidatus Saccharimonadales bacterium]
MHSKDALDRTFYISLILKGLDSTAEILGGIILLFISADTINSIVRTLTQHELSTDPHDFISTHLVNAAHSFTKGGRYFAAFYLLSHGIVKVVLIVALFKEKIWAYPWMMAVLGAFIIYQAYRMTYKFSFGLLVLTLFDIFIVCLTWLEYKKHKSRLRPELAAE